MEQKQYKAFNAFIFAGSFSIGVMNAGFDLEGVLEMTDEMLQQNAFYFHKNYPNIPVILPKEWENDKYLDDMKAKNIDLMCCNCPCSSLSRVNRYAKIDGKNNIHFYRLFNIFKHVQPKVFVIENAPTLIKLGKPILNDMVNQLNDLYRFTIIRDLAGNHNVPMKRMRTMIVGWRKDIFSKNPIINEDAHEKVVIKDVLQDIYSNTVDDCKSYAFDYLKPLYKYAICGMGIIGSLAQYLITGTDAEKKEIIDFAKDTHEWEYILKVKSALEEGRGFWDKTPKRMKDTSQFPSLSGPQEYMHPFQNRCLNILELQRMMNYPDSFDFHDDKHECLVKPKIAIGQGVPVNFGKWIAEQVKLALDKKLKLDESGKEIIFQNHCTHCYSSYSLNEFNELESLT